MLGTISVSTGTYMTWQTILALLTIVSMGIGLYRAKKGPSKDEMTYFREEVMRRFAEIKSELDDQTDRLEAHIDRTHTRARSRKKLVDD
jgi:hypothetical protein